MAAPPTNSYHTEKVADISQILLQPAAGGSGVAQ